MRIKISRSSKQNKQKKVLWLTRKGISFLPVILIPLWLDFTYELLVRLDLERGKIVYAMLIVLLIIEFIL